MTPRTRTVVVAAGAVLVYVLLQVEVTVPALSLAGLVAWAVFATFLAWPAITRKDDRS